MSAAPPQQIVARAIAALRRGEAANARAMLEQAAEAGGTVPWLALARACSLLGDAAGEEAALVRRLDEDKRDLPALLAMGELKARLGDRRAAAAFFQTALGQAAVASAVPPQLTPLLERAAAFVRESGGRYAAHLEERLAALIPSPSRRVAHALDLLRGAVPLYLQQPSMFYFPGLPQRPFYERDDFDWIADLEASAPQLRAELDAVLARGEEFEPYVMGTAGRPLPNNKLLRDPAWSAYYLWRSGSPVTDHAERCPATMAALAWLPLPSIPGRSPMALWSILRPGTHIAPHHGLLNTRLICHLPLLVPPGCAIRVGPETRAWEQGRALIFDDSFEHEAWNRGAGLRVVLLFEIWRPEIDADERIELTRLFEAIDLFPDNDG